MTSINQFQFSGLCTLSNFVCLHPSGIRHDRYTNYQIAFPTTTTTSVSAQSPRAYVDNDRRRRSSVGIWHKVDPIFSLVMVKVDGPVGIRRRRTTTTTPPPPTLFNSSPWGNLLTMCQAQRANRRSSSLHAAPAVRAGARWAPISAPLFLSTP